MKKLFAAVMCAAVAVASACAIQAAAPPPPEGKDVLKVHVLDIGQGDSIFIELPGKKSMLIDAGNPGDGDTVLQYIGGLGYASLDYVVGTHPHADHIGGLDEVVNGMQVKSVYLPNAISDTKNYMDLLQAVKNKGLKIKEAKAGAEIPGGDGLKMTFVAPSGTQHENLNNYSAVLKITYGARSFLFSADAEAEAEAEITADIRSDVLKVGHHGSDTSTSDGFLKRVSPQYAVISVGEGNTYGHPVQSTLDKLEKAGARILRTDTDGAVTFVTDGSSLTVETASTPAASKGSGSPASNGKPAESSSPPASSTTAEAYILNTNTKKFHLASCSQAKRIKPENRGSASTREDAVQQGFIPCKVCNP